MTRQILFAVEDVAFAQRSVEAGLALGRLRSCDSASQSLVIVAAAALALAKSSLRSR